MRSRPLALRWSLAVAFGALAVPAAGATPPVRSIEGLVAWYDLTPIHERTRDKTPLRDIPDASQAGHDLQATGGGAPAVFRVQRIGGKPAVDVSETAAYDVARPFSLGEHTIFLVYRPGCDSCALFRSEKNGEGGYGVVLRDDKGRDAYKDGQRVVPYGEPGPLDPQRFVIAVLGRGEGRMREFVDGADVSSNVKFDTPIRVGRWFRLDQTRYVALDGAGLELAEVIVYYRWLSRGERVEVTRYLADKFGIDVVEPPPEPDARVRLPEPGEAAAMLVLQDGVELTPNEPKTLVWGRQEKAGSGLSSDPEHPSRLVCGRDGLRVRVVARVPVSAANATTSVRLLLLRDGTSYLPEQGRSGELHPAGEQYGGVAAVEARLTLDAGDWIEVVAVAEPARPGVTAGPVRIGTAGALLSAEVLGAPE